MAGHSIAGPVKTPGCLLPSERGGAVILSVHSRMANGYLSATIVVTVGRIVC
jgi:hypothetical protein